MTAQTARRPIYTTNRNGAPARWTTQPATTAQVGMIRSLAAKVALDDEIRTRLDQALIAGMTKGKASETIDWLGRRPVRQDAPVRAARPALPEVAAGRYAVEVEGTLGFYRVDRPTTGNWAGRTFVKVQASDELHPVRGAAVAAVLAKIAVDPQAALLRYGREIGSCGHCNRTLTDEESRAYGVGPVCRKRLGW